jgi:hypothetical protein
MAETGIRHADTDAEIAATFDVMRQLRPHLDRGDYVARIRQLFAHGPRAGAPLLFPGGLRHRMLPLPHAPGLKARR